MFVLLEILLISSYLSQIISEICAFNFLRIEYKINEGSLTFKNFGQSLSN